MLTFPPLEIRLVTIFLLNLVGCSLVLFVPLIFYSHEDIRYIAVKLVYFFTFISHLKNHTQGNLRVIVLLFRHTEGVLEPFDLSPVTQSQGFGKLLLNLIWLLNEQQWYQNNDLLESSWQTLSIFYKLIWCVYYWL